LIVATEICEKTGSWLADYVVDEELKKYFLDKKLDTGRNIFNIPTNEGVYKTICQKYQIKSKKLVIRETSTIQDCLGYRIHTNRELFLMIYGQKDFSVFVKHIGENINIYNNQKFGYYRKKIFTKIYVYKNFVYYLKYRTDAKWKVDTYKMLIKTRDLCGNSEQLEFLEGSLLGYSDSQNIEFIHKFFRQI
jgi:hypothetical protein